MMQHAAAWEGGLLHGLLHGKGGCYCLLLHGYRSSLLLAWEERPFHGSESAIFPRLSAPSTAQTYSGYLRSSAHARRSSAR